jgi:methionine-rich copper-binding protein CopC
MKPVIMTQADRARVDLDLNGHTGFISDYAVPAQPTDNGLHLIEWHGLGVDGHALNNTFSFMEN